MDLVSQFEHYLENEKRYSKNTVIAYLIDLQQFFTFVNQNTKIEYTNVNFRHVRSWVVSLLDNKLSSKSVNRKISSLKKFYKFLLRENLIKHNPTEKVISPKISKRLPVFVEEKQMQIITDEINYGNDYNGLLNKLIISLFYGTGIRLSELINLKLFNIDFYNNTIKVIGKRNKERIIPFGQNLKHDIDNYLVERKKIVTKSDNLLISKKGIDLYPKFIYRIVKHYINLVATIDKKSPHVLRHTYATHLLNNGADLNAIKELLGHANLAATQVYTHNSFEKLKNIYKKAHPRV